MNSTDSLKLLAYFHVHGPDRLCNHYDPVAKSTYFQGVSLLQHTDHIVFTQFVMLQ